MLYFSRGSFRGSLRMGDSVCPETLVSESIKVKPRNRLAVEAENLIVSLNSWSVEAEAIHGPEFYNPENRRPRFPVIQNGKVVEKYSARVW